MAWLILYGLSVLELSAKRVPFLSVKPIDRSMGMPSDFVYQVYKDADNHIWFCTDKGLVSYFHNEIKVFDPKHGIDHQVVYRLTQAGDKRYFVSTYQGGIYFLDRYNLKPFRNDLFGNKVIFGLEADKKGATWVAGDSVAGVIDQSNNWHPIKVQPLYEERQFLLLENGNALFLEGLTLRTFRFNEGKLKEGRTIQLPVESHQPVYLRTIGFHKNDFFLSDWSALYHFRQLKNGKIQLIERLEGYGANLETVKVTKNGELWLGFRDKGVVVRRNGKWHNYNAENYLGSNFVRSIEEDEEGHLWLATFGAGVFQVSDRQLDKFKPLTGPLEQQIYCSAIDAEGKFWFAGTNSLYHYTDHDFVAYKLPKQVNNVRAMAFINGSLIASTYDNVFALKRDKVGEFKIEENLLIGGASALISDGDLVLASTYGQGLKWLSLEGRHQNTLSRVDGLPNDNTDQFFKDSKGNIWALNNNWGVAKVRDGKLLTVLGKKIGWRFGGVSAMAEMPNEAGYLFSTEAGLVLFNEESNSLELIDNRIKGARVFFYRWGRLFVITEKTIFSKPLSQVGKVGLWDKHLSLRLFADERCIINQAEMNSQFLLGLATNKGIFVHNLKDWSFYKGRYTVFYQYHSGMYDNTPNGLPFLGVKEDTIVEMPADIDKFKIKFQANTFTLSQDPTFRFIVDYDGTLDTQFVHDRKAYIYKPQPGVYKLRLDCIGLDGMPSSNELRLSFIVLSPWWQRWWGVLLIVASAASLLWLVIRLFGYLIYRARLRRLEIFNQIQLERVRISRDLHDNVGAQLVFMQNALDDTQKRNDPEVIKKDLSNLVELSKQTIQNLRESIWVLHQGEEIGYEDFVERIYRYVEHLHTHTSKKIIINAPLNGDVVFTPTQALNLFRIIQEALNNAVKHSACTQIEVRVALRETFISIIVSDDGRGINTKEFPFREGYGLKNMRHRAEEVKAELQIANQTPNGTIVSVGLKLNSSES